MVTRGNHGRCALHLASLIIVSLATLLTTSCSAADQGTDGPLHYGGQYYAGELLLLGLPGLWAQCGVNVEHMLFSSGAENNEALLAGTVDVNCGADTRTVALFNAIPAEALIIGTVEKGDRYATIVAPGSGYETWHDLTGKTVATRFGTGAEGVLRKHYTRSGLDWEDFTYVNLKIEDMTAALQRGQIEAFTAWEPTGAIAVANGAGRILMSYGDVSLVPASIHTTRSFAYNNEDAVVRFLAAHVLKSRLIADDPTAAAAIAASAARATGAEVPPDAFESVFHRIDFSTDIDDDVIQSIEHTAEFLLQQGKIDHVPALSWDTSFLERAIQLADGL